MSIREFIEKKFDKPQSRVLWCSSVMVDEQGSIYSYGRHYPLAWTIGEHKFINTTGYSNSTAKHISWAWQAVGYDAIGVELALDSKEIEQVVNKRLPKFERLEVIQRALKRQEHELRALEDSKKRKDTQVYASIVDELEKVQRNLKRIEIDDRGWS